MYVGANQAATASLLVTCIVGNSGRNLKTTCYISLIHFTVGLSNISAYCG